MLRSLLGHEWVRSWLGDEACGQFREELVTAILLTLLRLAPIVFLPVGLQVHAPQDLLLFLSHRGLDHLTPCLVPPACLTSGEAWRVVLVQGPA